MGNALASVQNVSMFEASEFSRGFMSNPGANAFYFENPLYTPILLQPVDSRTGNVSAGSGILVPPYSWVTFPVDTDNDVAFSCTQQNRIAADLSGYGRFSAMPRINNPALLGLADAIPQVVSSGSNIPPPRGARYYYFDTDSPTFTKGSVFRDLPLGSAFAMQGNGQLYNGFLGMAPGSALAYASAGRNAILTTDDFGGTSQFGFWSPVSSQGGSDDRIVIIGLGVTLNQAPVYDNIFGYNVARIPGNLGMTFWYDECIANGKYYVDVYPRPIGNYMPAKGATAIANWIDFHGVQWHGQTPNDIFIPVPGARSFCFYDTGTAAARISVAAETMVTVYTSEY